MQQQINSLNSDEQEKTQQPKTYSYFGAGGAGGNNKPVRHEEEKGSSPYTAYLEKINAPVIKPQPLLEGNLIIGTDFNKPRNLIISKSAK